MIYFTSDNHFFHKNVIDFCDRPFENVHRMNEGMIKRWNGTVRQEDTVIVVGDFCFGNSTKRAAILNRLNGTKILVQGNHDKAKSCPEGFDLMVYEMTMQIAGQSVSIRHYPLRWSDEKRAAVEAESGYDAKAAFQKKPRYLDRMPKDVGQWHIHGHTHDSEKFNGRQIHVGVDAWDYTPISIQKIESHIMSYEANNEMES